MDLNLIVDAAGLKNGNVAETVKKAVELGFHTVALNTIVDSKNLEGKNIKVPEPMKFVFDKDVHSGHPNVRILNRLTAVVKDSIHCHHLLQNAVTKMYDIIAVQPVGEKMLQHVCGNLDIEIIALDFSEKLPFSLKRTYLRQALDKGILFEILYAPCLRDQTARRNVIANCQVLVDISKGKNIIISSGAENVMELRGVHDVVNLASLFGFNENSRKEAVLKNGQKVLSHSFTRLQTGCGFVGFQDIKKMDKWIVDACVVPRKT